MKKGIILFCLLLSSLYCFSQITLFGETIPTNNIIIRNKLKKTIKLFKQQGITQQTLQHRANILFPIFDKILYKYNIPLDFKYLSVVESCLNINATSIVNAKGLWQIMPATGRELGMIINKNLDERLNINISTEVACIYLKKNKKYLGSWILAGASYNCGLGCINKAINKAKTDNFFSLSLNKETSDYIYRILATKLLFENETYKNLSTEFYKKENDTLDDIKNDTSIISVELAKKPIYELNKTQIEYKEIDIKTIEFLTDYINIESKKIKVKIKNNDTDISNIIAFDYDFDTVDNRLYLTYNYEIDNDMFVIRAIDKDYNYGISIQNINKKDNIIYLSNKRYKAKILNIII